MNNRNDDHDRERRPGQYGQARTRYDYGDHSEGGRTRQQAQGQGTTGRGEYYGGSQFSERAQGASWDEERGSWDYEGGPERYSATGYGEGTEQANRGQAYREQAGRQSGGRSAYGSQREYGSQGRGSSDYYRGRQGYGAQGSYGSEYNTYGRNQSYGEGSGYTRSNQPRSQQGSQWSGSQGYRSPLQSGSQDYLDEGEMSGYGRAGSPQYGSASDRYGTAPGQYRYGVYGRGYRGVGPKNYTRSDARLTEDINERLTDDDDLDPSEIMVRVADGKVTLEGHVDQRWMKHRAEDIADACTGVKEVDNRIQVTSGSRLEPDAGTRGLGARPSQTTGTTTGTPGGTGGTTPH
ncbi:BON domain-containing protein [Lysobacter sp. P5_B9]